MSIYEQVGFVAILLALGVICLMAPLKVQKYYARHARFEEIRKFIESDTNLRFIQVSGVIALLAGLSMLWALVSAYF
jgi:hypothetical protein